MIPISQVQRGVAQYVDAEIVAKMSGWQKWVFGAGAGVVASKMPGIVSELKQNKFTQMLGLVNDRDEIDVDTLYAQFLEQARRTGAITVSIPMIGALTLNEDDVTRLYQYIVNGG